MDVAYDVITCDLGHAMYDICINIDQIYSCVYNVANTLLTLRVTTKTFAYQSIYMYRHCEIIEKMCIHINKGAFRILLL
jgi:hypothetical protein